MFFSFLNAQNVNLVWAKNMGSASFDQGSSVAVDASGNVYTTGYFQGTADFDPGPGTYNLTSAGLEDIFISKLDASGNFVWAKSIGGASYDNGYSIAIDASGNVYTTGYYYDTVDFDPGAGTYNLTSPHVKDIFVSKLDASGNFVWAKNMGGDSDAVGYSIAVDISGNVYTTGHFQGTADFDPGAGTYNLTSTGQKDIFVSKLDASGNFVWAKDLGGSSNENGHSVTVDASGNVYTTGYFQGTADFDPGAGTYNLTSAGGDDIFVSKLDASGNFVWAKNMGGAFYDDAWSVAVDASGNVYTTGYFRDIADFDPGPGTYNLTSAGQKDIFVSKLDASGNFVWAKNMGGVSSDVGYSIAVDASGNVYTTGGFWGTADFDPGAATYNLTSSVQDDIFVSKLDASGNFVWAKNMADSSDAVGYSIALDASGNVYTTGAFNGTSDFDPGPGTYNLTSAGSYDIFVVKLNQVAALPVTLTNVKAYQRNAGVQVEWIAQQENNIDRYEVERSQNAQQFTKLGSVKAKGNSSVVINYNLFDPNPFSGINFYRIKIIEADQVTYSQVVKVNVRSGSENMITIYPNPVIGNSITLQVNDLQKGSYTISLTNKLGQQIMNKLMEHAGGSATETIEFSKALAAGVYQLSLTGPGINIIRQVIKN